MRKTIKANFSLSEKEIREAIYDFYVKKLKDNRINSVFSVDDIDLGDTKLEANLTIIETKEI